MQKTTHQKNFSFDTKQRRKEEIFDEDGLGLTNENPFSSYYPYGNNSKRSFYNKDKIKSYIPQMNNHHIDEIPQNCQ